MHQMNQQYNAVQMRLCLLVMLLSTGAAFLIVRPQQQLPKPHATAVGTMATRTQQMRIPCRCLLLQQQSTTNNAAELETALSEFETALKQVESTISKTCKVRPVMCDQRLGLVATENVNKGDVLLAMPYGGSGDAALSADTARRIFQGILPEKYEGWTGDAGLIALNLLHELALAASSSSSNSSPETTNRKVVTSAAVSQYKRAWLATLPHVDECSAPYPLLWPEEDQEVLQRSSTSKIYRILDDIEEDVSWLKENVFSKSHKNSLVEFPETVQFRGRIYPCFSSEGFTWAMTMVQSRSFFLDGQLRLIPLLDLVNHKDDALEVRSGYMGPLRTVAGSQLVADVSYKAGEQVYCSYGPKSAMDYLLEHGFVPDRCWKQRVSELTFEVSPDDRFYQDKLDILEFETYDSAPMDPSQSFDVVSIPGRINDGQPDPSMIQFVRLCKLGGTDAFLLESIFRKDVWGFMSLPVSEQNEFQVISAISHACQAALEEFDKAAEGTTAVVESDDNESNQHLSLCAKIREAERIALTKTLEFLKREKEALDLKEYYQERRLKDLGLDSDWSPEDEYGSGGGSDDGLSYGQTRLPGGADYDW